MSEVTPNRRQQKLIDNTDGIYVVDAGPGTGKTFTITRRYAEIVAQPSTTPEDVLLVTFTRSAATEMRERIVDVSEAYGMHELADAPIQTFHAHCFDVLQEYGHAAPTHLGIDDRITGSTRIIDDELVETELFTEFIGQFRDAHPEYADWFRALSDPTDLLELITQLASKGVFPTAKGWYRGGETHLDGDFEMFKTAFDAANQPQNDGRKQSNLRAKLNEYGKSKTYLPDAPSKSSIRGSGTKRVADEVARRVFDADRARLKRFVHDVYHEYLQFALRRNYLTFGFLQLFAFVLLCENDAVREAASFEYVMIDEFQDSSEIQFKLALLLTGAENFCVVGDWKQSIYSFQYAAVENITDFSDRLRTFAEDLNTDSHRVGLDPASVSRITLDENYRATDSLIRFSEHALETPATNSEDVSDQPIRAVTELNANAAFDNSRIEAHAHADEHEAVLAKLQAIVGNDAYAVADEDGEPRTPTYDDIAVLTRTRDFGRELLTAAEEHDVPLSYDGGVELFRTDPAKLLLAWLRILDADADRGWAVVLEHAGYTLDEAEHIMARGDYPSNLRAFRETLAGCESVGTVARRVLDRYGFHGEYADVLLGQIQSLHDTTTLTRGHLIRLIERGIEIGSTHEIHTNAGADSATVQTIHSVKGLEYPIVILANMNDGVFPPRSNATEELAYHETVGLRTRKRYSEVADYPHVYDNWRYDVYRHCLPDTYSEERRLLYVAITRAEQHVCFMGGETPNTFLEALPVEVTEPSTNVRETERSGSQTQFPFTVAPPEGPTGYTPHSLMDESVFENESVVGDEPDVDADPHTGYRGTDFGSDVHEFAEAYALGEGVSPTNEDERAVRAFIDKLGGELRVEEPALLPLEVDGESVTISGVVDLVHIRPDRIEIIDFKTDQTRRAHDEYRKQLSVYYHVLTTVYPDRDVTASAFYTADAECVTIDPLSKQAIQQLVEERSRGE